MIDCLLKFTDEPTARADSVVGKYYSPDGGWRGDLTFSVDVFQNGMQDTTGWFIWIALDHVDQALVNHPNLVIAADRDKAIAGDPSFILATPIAQADLNSYTISPVVAGSAYPFGNAP